MRNLFILVAVVLSSCVSQKEETPLIMLRLSASNTASDEQWEKSFQAIKENPGCCDEIWFSTGTGIRTLQWHEEKAQRLAKAFSQLEEIGIKGSLQIQATIGHGDSFGDPNSFSAKKWGGWTGSTGIEDVYCNCPSQSAFIEYAKNVARIYAAAKPYSVWIDDDLRFENHYPASQGSHIGCWCDTCIAKFNHIHSSSWTRETLSKAIESDNELEKQWRKFSTFTLKNLAGAIASEVHKVSPETKMGFQHTYRADRVDYIQSIVDTLYQVSGKPVSYRPGAGDYYDWDHAFGQINKSMHAADFSRIMNNPENIDTWVPEVESWPRTYGSRTAQGTLVEAFAAVAYGMNGVSYFTTTEGIEEEFVYSYYMYRPISLGTPVLKAYIKANRGTEAIGYTTDESRLEVARLGIPVLIGKGKRLGHIAKGEIKVNPTSDNTATIQKMRSNYPSPVTLYSPYFGLVVPRITPEGELRTVGLLNTRIDSQWRIKIQLNYLPTGTTSVIWHEMKKEPQKLNIDEDNCVTIAEISAWNGGFIEIAK